MTGPARANVGGRRPGALSHIFVPPIACGFQEAPNSTQPKIPVSPLLTRPPGTRLQNLRYLLLKAQRMAATRTEFVVFRKAA
jgi:hypothetical protein